MTKPIQAYQSITELGMEARRRYDQRRFSALASTLPFKDEGEMSRIIAQFLEENLPPGDPGATR